MPLLYQVYRTLRRGWKSLTPEAQMTLKTFVASQKTAGGYMNAGGHEDEYYKQFGEVLEAVFSPRRLIRIRPSLTVQESRNRNTVYGHFFQFLEAEMRMQRPREVEVKVPRVLTTNAACCILAMQKQTGRQPNAGLVAWVQERQDETGCFYASEHAPIPDLLSTSVALFTLRLLAAEAKDASDFIQAHWLESGGFMPTLLDEYSDVEYCFYGLLALGSLRVIHNS